MIEPSCLVKGAANSFFSPAGIRRRLYGAHSLPDCGRRLFYISLCDYSTYKKRKKVRFGGFKTHWLAACCQKSFPYSLPCVSRLRQRVLQKCCFRPVCFCTKGAPQSFHAQRRTFCGERQRLIRSSMI